MMAAARSLPLLLALLALSADGSAAAAPAPYRPHVVWIVADDLGWADTPVPPGSPSNILTPALSALMDGSALDGSRAVRLSNYYVMHLCSPSRSAYMSGRHPIHTGLQHAVIFDAVRNGLPLNETTLFELLGQPADGGYTGHRHMVGKWHLGFYEESYTPYRRGADTFLGYFTGNADYMNHTSPCFSCGNYTAVDLGVVDGPGQAWAPILNQTGTYSTNLFASRAVQLIQATASASASASASAPPPPSFFYLPFEACHGGASCDPDCKVPYGDILQAPPEYVARNPQIRTPNRKTYGGMVAALDEAVGNITAALKAAGMWDDTVLLFTTDNGAPSAASGFNGTAMSNFPLRGQKGGIWEGGVRGAALVVAGKNVPLSFAPPDEAAEEPARGGASSGGASVFDGLVHAVDIYPTLAHIAGIPDSALPPGLDGVNVWEWLWAPTTRSGGSGRPTSEAARAALPPYPRTEALIHVEPIANWTGLRSGDWKILTGMGPEKWYGMAGVEAPPAGGPLDPPTLLDPSSPGGDPVPLDSVVPMSAIESDPSLRPLLPLLHADGSTPLYLFNVTSDPEERNNLAATFPAVVQTLLARVAAYAATAVPCRFPPPDPEAEPALHNRSYWAPWVTAG